MSGGGRGSAPGCCPVTLFAALLGVATVIHWDRFNHGHVAFWLWAGLYFTAPFLVLAVWVANQRVAAPPRPDELRIGAVARVVVAAGAGLALVQGLVMFAVPSVVIPVWPWLLTPLTCRVVGAVFCLGSAGLVVLRDTRWVRLRLMVEVEVIMLTLMLVGAVRARTDLYTDRPLTWLLLVASSPRSRPRCGSGAPWRRAGRPAESPRTAGHRRAPRSER